MLFRSASILPVDRDLPDLLDNFFSDEEIEAQSISADKIDLLTSFVSEEFDDFSELAQLDEFELIALIENDLMVATESVTTDAAISATALGQPITTTVEVKRSISIPVPLERLDRSAQQVVDTLLTARAVRNISNQLQFQLSQLNVLTQESSQFVTRLRQLQDDYAQIGRASCRERV